VATYPPISAGQRITAGLLTAMLPNVIVKPTTTARASTTTFANDPDLQTTLAANAQYYVEFRLMAAALSTADFRTQWTVPTGASGLKGVMGPAGGSTPDNNGDNLTVRLGVHQFGTAVVYQGARNDNTLAFYVNEWGVITTGAAGGTLALAWAQGTSNATATQLFGGSVMIVRRTA